MAEVTREGISYRLASALAARGMFRSRNNGTLDFSACAQVSDFWLSLILSACDSHISTVLTGTFWYIPLEYSHTMVATTKGDVYSFGVVMLEL
ncbi:hypothetical protein LguiB_013335 [Lonicera macranthoides]